MRERAYLLRTIGIELALVFLLLGHCAVPVQALAQQWDNTGSMANGRYYYTATLLPNGKVLVAGGSGHSSAELYDPAAGTWSLTGSMAAARGWHTATLLPNGLVLVTGGWNGSVSLSSAELYNPATGTWSTAGSMAAGRFWHTATLLPNGKVLVAGGLDGSIYLSSAELYDPVTGTWSATGAMAEARYTHAATLLPNGLLLIAGGYNGTVLSSAELYNPGTGTWSTTGSMMSTRYLLMLASTLLPNGKVLVAGGYGAGVGPLSSGELYDPVTGIWSATGSMAVAREDHTTTLLNNGKVLVAGGWNGGPCPGPNCTAFSSAELYDPATETWSATGSMAAGRFRHTATLLPNGKVLVAGGHNGSAPTPSAEIYNSPPAPFFIGVFRNGVWYLDMNGNGLWNPAYDTVTYFGLPGDVPVTGDWTGTHKKKIGVFRNQGGVGVWYLDLDGNGIWNPANDTFTYFGLSGDVPVTGDWTGTGATKIGVFRNGEWYLDNGDRAWAWGTMDRFSIFGLPGDVPVTGDWDGTGTTKIGVFRNGVWYLDMDGDGWWNPTNDTFTYFGLPGDVPVTGDWDDKGVTKIGVFRNQGGVGVWYLDMDGNGLWNPANDTVSYFGLPGDVPATGDWAGPALYTCIPSGDQNDINARLVQPGDVAVLCSGAVFELTAPVVFSADGQQIYTEGFPSDDRRAVLRVTSVSEPMAVLMRDRSDAVLSNVSVYGNRPNLGPRSGQALIYAGGWASGQVIRGVKAFDTRSWSTIQLIQGGGSIPCSGALVENNEIGPAGQPDGSWADGISLGCTNSVVRNNTITDATDGGIVIFGAPGSLVEGNVIRAESRMLLGGINMVDFIPYDGDYTGTVVHGNVIDAAGAVIRIGMAMGTHPWWCQPNSEDTNYGAVVTGNSLRGEYMQYGFAVDGVRDWTVMDNEDLATHSGTPTVDCGGIVASPPAGFQYHSARANGSFQEEFTEANLDLALWAIE